jgi:UbiD family decarboxylase
MGFKDLRSFLAALEREKQLIRYSDSVQQFPDVGLISRAVTDMGHYGPAVLLDNIAGYKGKKLVVGVHGSWANHALMFGLPKESTLKEQFYALCDMWENYPGEVVYVDDPPCQEVVIDKGINLYEIMPLYRINRLDGGCYFSKACVVTSEPYDFDNLGATNVGMYRVQIQRPDTLGIQIASMHDGGEHVAQAEKEGEALPIAICLGNDPLLSFMAATPVAYGESEYHYASAMGGFTYELTRSQDGNIPIPANAEYVIEGYIVPGKKRTVEGPFGEYPGTYTGLRRQLEVKVTKVTHRVDPIFESLYIGFPWNEADTLTALNTSIPLYKQVKADFPLVTAVNAVYQHGNTVILSTEQRYAGQAKTVAMRLLSTPHGSTFARNLIIVDSEVDPFNLEEVMWALSTRVRSQDISVIEAAPGSHILPCVDSTVTDRKLIIDATTPCAPDKMPKDVKVCWKEAGVADFVKTLTDMRKTL